MTVNAPPSYGVSLLGRGASFFWRPTINNAWFLFIFIFNQSAIAKWCFQLATVRYSYTNSLFVVKDAIVTVEFKVNFEISSYIYNGVISGSVLHQ
jgi:hypothetical protein